MEAQIRANDLLQPGGEVTALVSGGADSTCLWHILGALGYRVSALHVDHGLRGRESDEDARFCREVLGAERLRRQGYFQPAAVARLIDEHVARREDRSRQLWGLLAFTLWHERHVERTPGRPRVPELLAA